LLIVVVLSVVFSSLVSLFEVGKNPPLFADLLNFFPTPALEKKKKKKK